MIKQRPQCVVRRASNNGEKLEGAGKERRQDKGREIGVLPVVVASERAAGQEIVRD